MKQRYQSALQHLEKGEIPLVTEALDSLRQEYEQQFNPEVEGLRRLISARLQLKTNLAKSFEISSLDPKIFTDDYLKAETYFVKGLIYYHHNLEAEGSDCFSMAQTLYPLPENGEKALLAEYNAFIGRLNQGQLSASEQELKLVNLEKRSLELGSKKIQAWVLRQKSYHLEDQKKFKGALLSMNTAIELFKETGPISDLYLAQLSEIDLHIELGHRELAEMKFEALIGPIDERVAFARAYIESRLSGKSLNMSAFLSIPPRWKMKAQTHFGHTQAAISQISWDEDGMINLDAAKTIFISPTTVEGNLLRLLIDKKSNRSELCERLWPEEAESQLIWNRFHQVVTRLNKKLNGFIIFENGYYSLSKAIRLNKSVD